MSSSDASAAHVAPINPVEARIGEALDELRTFRARFWAPALLGLIMLFDSWDSITIAYVMPSLIKEWGISPAIVGSLISSGYVGQFLGAILLGGLAERFGRMPVFAGSVVVMGLLALGCAFSPNYHVLLGIRFVQGLAIGGALPVSITYVNELAPTLTRGRYFAIFQWLCMSGYAAASLSSTVVIPELGWRWLFGMGATPLVLLPLAMLTLPESPRWLARIGRGADAEKALSKLGGSLAPLPAGAELPPAPPPAARPRTRFSALFLRPYLARTVVIIGLWFLTSFANFGLTTWVPSIYVTVFHMPVTSALKFAAIASTLFLVATPLIAAVVDTVGRRPFAIFGTAMAGTALGVLTIYQPTEVWLLVSLVVTGQLCISISSFIVWPFTAESYPTHVRAVALGMCSSTARAASMLTPLFVGVILSRGGSISLVFGVFSLFAFAAMILWWTATKETARVRLETL
jgi:putative MFS transporter